MYLIRLDDACEYMDVDKWSRMEQILDAYKIKPIVGVIPDCNDEKMKGVYNFNPDFWEKERLWEEKGWTIAMHGYEHQYCTDCAGINPLHNRSEFAGLSLEEQRFKIREGIRLLSEHNVFPTVFFAPGHTFDENTLEAIRKESNIRIISDTIATDVYFHNGFWFIPQQSGACRKLPFKVVTFCYHPNNMSNKDFDNLRLFINKNRELFMSAMDLDFAKQRKMNAVDRLTRKVYYSIRKARRLD